MNHIAAITLEVPDPEAFGAFPAEAFGLDDRFRTRASESPTTGFRGFTLSLVVSQPSTVDSFMGTAVAAGAEVLKPAEKSFWGYGCSLRDPGGAIWTIASSSKKETGPATRKIDQIVLLLGPEDVAASKRFYLDRGLEVEKAYGRKYVEFKASGGGIRLALNGRRSLAKNAGVSPEGTGSHRIVIGGGAGAFTDPDGFEWEAVTS
jgi:catechol 2,3-dioxygenase-like lactoylglutathione lyase family enzyme